MSTTKLSVKVVPGASRTEIAGWLGESLKIRVAAPPEGGKANQAVLVVLAGALSLQLSQMEIVSGQSQPRKVIAIAGLEAEELEKCLPSKGQ